MLDGQANALVFAGAEVLPTIERRESGCREDEPLLSAA